MARLHTFPPLLTCLDLDRRIADLEAELAAYREQRDADMLADAIEAGDCDRDGEPVGYDRYRSA
jgi:hypothetical protein